MKKFLLIFIAVLTMGSTTFGENLITVSDLMMSQSGNSVLLVNINLDVKYSAKGMGFNIELPEGVKFATDSKGKTINQTGWLFDVAPTIGFVNEREINVKTASSEAILGSKGLLLAFKITPTTAFSVGEELTGRVHTVSASISGGPVNLDDSNFKITVTDCVVMDENSPFDPEEPDEESDFIIRRTLTAGQWSTICLPFELDEATLTSIFGTDVELAEYKNYTYTNDPEELALNFTSVDLSDGFEANKPYLIKTTSNLTEFKITGEIDLGTVSVGKNSTGKFIGTYSADFIVPENKLFISDNKFYYSLGSTRMKAFRGYFDIKDVLSNPSSASTRAFINFGDGTTGIRNANLEGEETGKVYSMTGQYMGERESLKSLPKGVYIIDGKKVINK